ncbi:arylamine N-acetyltransferase family protein [Nocardioides pyridinolyticus]
MSATSAYLRRLGIEDTPPPTLDVLFQVHRRHLDRVPYENLGIVLGTPPSVDGTASLERVGELGRAGSCFHQNGALELVLRELGFVVTRRHGHVWTAEDDRDGTFFNHLVLHVAGLPSPENPGGEWWADVGLGDGFRDPLPLVPGKHVQGGFTYVIDEVRPDGWSFRHDPVAVLASHAEVSAPGSGAFARILVVQRRHAGGTTTIRGCLRTEVGAGGSVETELAAYDAWRDAIADAGVALEDVDESGLRALHERMWAAHEEWRR